MKTTYRKKAVPWAAFFIAAISAAAVLAGLLTLWTGTAAAGMILPDGETKHGGPDPPAQVHAASYSTSKIRISWELSENADGYEVYRAVSRKGNYQCCFTAANPEKDWYINTNRTPGKTYWYKLRAYRNENRMDADGGVQTVRTYSSFTEPVYAYARPSRVKITSLTSEGWIDRVFRLKWKPVGGAEGYQISIKPLNGEEEKSAFVFCGNYRGTEGTVMIPDKTKEYVLRVRAYKTVNGKKVYGLFSEEVTYTFDWNRTKLQESTESLIAEKWPQVQVNDAYKDGTAKTPYNASWSAAWPLRFSLYEPWEGVKTEVERALAEDLKQYGQLPETLTVYTEEAEPFYVHMYLLH